MAKPISIKLSIPAHIAATAEPVVKSGIYFGTTWTFTSSDQAGEHMMWAAISHALSDFTVEEIAATILAIRRNVLGDLHD